MLKAKALTEDGRVSKIEVLVGEEVAENKERMLEVISRQICKASNHYNFQTCEIVASDKIPFMPTAFLNNVRRTLARELDKLEPIAYELMKRGIPEKYRPIFENAKKEGAEASYKENISNSLATKVYEELGYKNIAPAYEIQQNPEAELMRTRYCIKYELGICPKYHKTDNSGRLYLTNNNRNFELVFDCKNCEMVIKRDS